ncbi:exported hypothetical protein [Streptomyces misionensis JCM 4497]
MCSGVPGASCFSSVKSTWVSARVSAPRRFPGVTEAGTGASSWGGAVLADTVNATSSVNHPSKAVIASQDMCTVCKHLITPCWFQTWGRPGGKHGKAPRLRGGGLRW